VGLETAGKLSLCYHASKHACPRRNLAPAVAASLIQQRLKTTLPRVRNVKEKSVFIE
jgi:hypothetical protein